jgi:hypothetical protein
MSLAGLWGCDDSGPKRGNGLVEGYVYLKGKTNHSGTEVRLGSRSALTDSTGLYAFDGVSDGQWSVHAIHAGYYEATEPFTVRDGFLVSPPADIYLLPALWSYVHLEGESNHTGICVYVDGDGPVWGTMYDGAYMLPPITIDGDHVLSFEFPEYAPVEVTISIVDGWPDPPLDTTTLPAPPNPIIIQMNDNSEPDSNPTQTPGEVHVAAVTQDGSEVISDDFVVYGNWGSNGCGGNYLTLSGLAEGITYDLILSVPRYFALAFDDGPLADPPDTLVLEGIVPQTIGALRTEFLSLLSYLPDELILVLDGGLTEEERETIISSYGCLIRERLWSSNYNAPMYILNLPDDKTELEMLDLFKGLAQTLMVSLATPGPFGPLK